ncbi:hypothetical protein [Sciscionella marina]|uniref:hypothetical protein n=1 Tax=Sciscionella marina TaxID=508770 RepID=UPI001969F9A9|nr:hypothetical protein [Sciscionella marina]
MSSDPRAFDELMAIRGDARSADGEVTISGMDPLFVSPFRIGETLADALAARAVAANDLWELRTGRRQQIGVNVRAAAATALGGEDMTLVRDEQGEFRPAPLSPDVEHMVSLTQPWQTADDRWFVPHFNLPHLERRVLDVLGCEPTPDSVHAAVRAWQAGRWHDHHDPRRWRAADGNRDQPAAVERTRCRWETPLAPHRRSAHGALPIGDVRRNRRGPGVLLQGQRLVSTQNSLPSGSARQSQDSSPVCPTSA